MTTQYRLCAVQALGRSRGLWAVSRSRVPPPNGGEEAPPFQELPPFPFQAVAARAAARERLRQPRLSPSSRHSVPSIALFRKRLGWAAGAPCGEWGNNEQKWQSTFSYSTGRPQ